MEGPRMRRINLKKLAALIAALSLILAILTVANVDTNFDARYAEAVAIENAGLSREVLRTSSEEQRAVATCGREAFMAADRFPDDALEVYDLLGCQSELARAIEERGIFVVPFIRYVSRDPDGLLRTQLAASEIVDSSIKGAKWLYRLLKGESLEPNDKLDLSVEYLRRLFKPEEGLSEEALEQLHFERATFALVLVLEKPGVLTHFVFMNGSGSADVQRLFLATFLHGTLDLFTGSSQTVERKLRSGETLTGWDAFGVALEVAIVGTAAKAGKALLLPRVGKSAVIAKGVGTNVAKKTAFRHLMSGTGKVLRPFVKPTIGLGVVGASAYMVWNHPDLVLSAAYNVATTLGWWGSFALVAFLTVVFWPAISFVLIAAWATWRVTRLTFSTSFALGRWLRS